MENQQRLDTLRKAAPVSDLALETTRTAARKRLFTGQEEHKMSLEDASRLTHNYRMRAGKDAVKGAYVGRAILETILDQQRCVGIRVYFAKHLDGRPTFVLSGVESSGNDLFEGPLGEEVWLCPPWCSPVNRLNSDVTVEPTAEERKPIFTGMENHFVTLAEASRLTRNYRDTAPPGSAKGGYFGGNIFRKILAQPRSVGLRIYFAEHDNGTPTLVLVGVDREGSDLVYGEIGQEIWLCPPWCAKPNPLNN
ncbi:MAG: hypothetical protein WBD36_08230 [Bacteroidota bacterium]